MMGLLFRWTIALAVVFLLSTVGSVTIGIVCGKVELALAIMATIAGWIACFEGLLLFLHPWDFQLDRNLGA